MNLWAHTLVKNEARWLWFSLTSVLPYVDKVLLYDSGSTDGSIEIEKELQKRFPEKIILKNAKIESAEDFTKVRQEMLDATKSDWFLMVDGDEIWWEDSIKKVMNVIKSNESNKGIESIVVPTVNLVGDIFHYQPQNAGKYKFSSRVGHYNLRAVRRDIPGLHSQGVHGIWGWADGDNKMIQDRNTFEFVDAPYLHATFLPRAGSRSQDSEVIKRKNKLKYEIGKSFPLDFFYPEVFFKEKPSIVESPWVSMSKIYKSKAFFETPLRKIKRKLIWGKPGY
jgi:glycosyltransferase involved in cell wall biosynthesis